MAGIGFELRKAMGSSSGLKRSGGYFSAAFTCFGGMLIGIVLLSIIQIAASAGGISQAVLTARLGVDKAAVARVLKSLEEKGYIYRETDPEDKRVKRVYPLDKAQSSIELPECSAQAFVAWLREETL